MPKYLVTTSKDVIRYISYVVEANSQEEAEENWYEGEWQMNGMNHQEILMLKNLKK